jgi:hypothetical protein
MRCWFRSLNVGVLSLFASSASFAQAPEARPSPSPVSRAFAGWSDSPRAASSRSDIAASGVSIGLLAGYGASFSGDWHKLGTGVRFGYTLPQHSYFGMTYVYHWGNEATGDWYTSIRRVEYLGGEFGHVIGVGSWAIRPFLGLGSVWLGEGFGRDVYVGLWPGMAITYRVGWCFFGVDARFLGLTGDRGGPNQSAFSSFFTTGVNL